MFHHPRSTPDTKALDRVLPTMIVSEQEAGGGKTVVGHNAAPTMFLHHARNTNLPC
jgi:hypothetical protein